MELNSTTKLSLICSLAGIGLLYMGAMQMRPGLTPISKIDRDFVGLKTRVSGRVIDLSRHSKGHIFLKVKDRSGGVISVPIFASTSSELDEKVNLMDNIQVTGKVENYEGELELIPGGADSIKIINTPPGEISEIDETKVGQTAKLRGNIREKTSVGQSGLLLELWDDGESLKVYIPSNVAGSEKFQDIGEGDRIQVGGVVQTYEGDLELKVSSSYNLEIFGESG